jgi:hypothetical protein
MISEDVVPARVLTDSVIKYRAERSTLRSSKNPQESFERA